MSLTSQFTFGVSALLTGSADLTTPSSRVALSNQLDYASGTGAGQADKLFVDTRTLAASATEDLDLAGVLTDPLGATLTFVKIKGLLFRAAAANVNNVVIGAAAGSPWAALLNATGTITLRPGMVFGVAAGAADATGLAVTATSADLLKVANSGAGSSVSYDVVIVGTSA